MNRTITLFSYHDEVTGSKTVIVDNRPSEGKTYRIVIDDGLFQEYDYKPNNFMPTISPDKIDAILITHSHMDHIGNLPADVGNGYRNPIFMSKDSLATVYPFLEDGCKHQEELVAEMIDRFPNEAQKFHVLYEMDDVHRTMTLCEGKEYDKEFEVIEGSGIYACFHENAHILGASEIYLCFKCYGEKDQVFWFTGDYKSGSVWGKVPPVPSKYLNSNVVMITESTYGTTENADIKRCFWRNIVMATEQHKDILIGAFAKERMQIILYTLKQMIEKGVIPEDYNIVIDGSLGLRTNSIYQMILDKRGSQASDFMPPKERIIFATAKNRESILSQNKGHVIVVTTSGMLSQGPARVYVPMFLENSNGLIHLCGYAAEHTLARALYDAQKDDTVVYNGETLKKRCEIKATSEFSSHATADELISHIKKFKHIKFVIVNHGETEVKEAFRDRILKECPNVEDAGVINRSIMYRFTYRNNNTSSFYVKQMPAKLDIPYNLIFGKEEENSVLAKKKNKKNGKKSKSKKSDYGGRYQHRRNYSKHR